MTSPKMDTDSFYRRVVVLLQSIVAGSTGGAVTQPDPTLLNTTETNSAAIKTAVETLDNFISGTKGLVTEDNSAAILAREKEIAGQDFLCITDTAAHGSLDCTMIYVMNDTVFSDITVAASNVVAGKGLTAITVVAGTLLPFGKAHATAITLTSGKVIAYIN